MQLDLKAANCHKLEERLETIQDDTDPDTYWDSLKNIIHDTALETFGLQKNQDPDSYRSSIDIMEETRKTLVRFKSRPTQQTRDNFCTARSSKKT